MSESWFENYQKWLSNDIDSDREMERQVAAEDFSSVIMASVAYHPDAKVNGEIKPIVASRTETRKSSLSVVPGHNIYIGDVINVFDETWLCVEMHTDEYGLSYGELWLCNHVFKTTDLHGNVISIPAIVDDGSYSKGTEKPIKSVDSDYQCYISLTNESESIRIDTRLPISKTYDLSGHQIMEVGKVSWIDVKTKNFGEGSHLLVFALRRDAYNPETDDLDLMMCDCKAAYVSDQSILTSSDIIIEGRASLMIGSGRTYKASFVAQDGSCNAIDFFVDWTCDNKNISLSPSNSSCLVKIPYNENLIGEKIILRCSDVANAERHGSIEIEVIDIG